MRPFRKTLNKLSAAAVLFSALCGIISGQSALTTIQDTLFDADGARYNGTLFIRWNTFDATNPGTVIQQSRSVKVVNGNLLVQLAPNNTALPPANLYSVLYQSDGNQQYTETWTVPVSATPMKVAQIRTGGGVGIGGDGSAGGLTGTPQSSITNLVSDLNARPIKGPGFGTNAVALINQNGQIETVVGELGDCVFVDGTTGPCTAGVTFPTFVNGEVPAGQINGLNTTFTLANSPTGSSLLLFRNGLLQKPAADYTLSGSTIQFLSSAVPQPNDVLLAQYRMDPGSGISDPGLAIGPSGVPGMNGCGAVGIASKSGAYQIVPGDNGYLIIQTANAGISLPAIIPAAGWCVALLNTNPANVTVGNSGNHLNGTFTSFVLGSANTAYVVSDGSGYWISAAAAGGSASFPGGTGIVKVTGGAAGLVAGAASDCVLVNGSSGACGGVVGGTNGQIQYNNGGTLSGFTPAVNGAGIATPSTLNFLNSGAFNGLQLTVSNPTGGSVQLGATGTLNNSGLTNSSFATAFPSWLSGTTPVALGGTLTVGAASGQTSHQVLGTCGTTTTFAPCALTAGDLPMLTRANGGLNSSSPGTGILRDGTTPTASELSGDATTSGSNAVTVTKTNGVAFAASATTDATNAANITSGTLPNARISALPNANLANSSVTVNGQAVSLGSTGNVNSGATAHTIAINQGNGAVITGAAAGTAKQRLVSGGAGVDPSWADDRDVKIIPFATAPAGTAGAAVSYPTGQWTPAARAGTNNIGAALQAVPSTGGTLQFLVELPGDWDAASQPYINIFYGSGTNTTGTAIWTVSSACSKQDGSVSDDPAFNAESAFASQTMAAANRMWAKGGQFTAMTSANNCVPGSSVLIRLAVSGTASATINAYQAVVTIPTLPAAAQVN